MAPTQVGVRGDVRGRRGAPRQGPLRLRQETGGEPRLTFDVFWFLTGPAGKVDETGAKSSNLGTLLLCWFSADLHTAVGVGFKVQNC